MKITSLHLTNFKRFTDLKIEGIPATSNLVLLIGSNGSGKSCVFDAFGFIDGAIKQDFAHGREIVDSYFKKKKDKNFSVEISFDNMTAVSRSSIDHHIPDLPFNTFYGRTSFRQVPRLTRTSLRGGDVNFEKDSDRSHFFIDKDNRFENDITRINEILYREIFQSNLTGEQIRKKYVDPVNTALSNIFGSGNGTKLQLLEIVPPFDEEATQITFRKGDSKIHYNFLGAGEKEVFNVLMNLLTRSALYQDTIYFIDEIDLHLNTKLQFSLLKEITENWLPKNCQLWTATHSLGFIEYARQSKTASIIDFDDLDFDLPVALMPTPKDNSDIYEIAVGKEFLPALFKGKDIYFVENEDAELYAYVAIPDTIFVKSTNRDSVYHTVRTTGHKGIIDRDFLSDDDSIQIREHYPKLFILKYYSIENYLYHPGNLKEYCAAKSLPFEKEEYISQLTAAKNQVKEKFLPTLSMKRLEYPFFREQEYNGKMLQNRFKNKGENEVQSEAVAGYLKSDDFETYYKSLPMKSYCTQLPQRQNISRHDLAKTTWFKQMIEELINTKS